MNRAEAVASNEFDKRYEIVSKLGEGGFGTVFKARQRATGQLVAIKVMRVVDADGAAQRGVRVARFLREARLCAQLHHPNIVQVVDTGEREDGALYTVFSFAPGDTLAAVLAREGALRPEEARYLMAQVLDALTCAHAQGVIHRDLKPSNIMIVPTGARRNAVVLDFGIGALLDGEARGESRLTRTQETVGTPGYCAPEQLRGLDPSPDADVFSWAVTFVECLTGHPIYTGTSAETLYQILAPEPVPLPVSLQRLSCFELLQRAVQKDVRERKVTAAELLTALDAADWRDLERGTFRALDVAHNRDERIQSGRRPIESLSDAAAARASGKRHVTAIACTITFEGDVNDDLLRGGLGRCVEIARDHGGYVASALGDALLVYFGYPQAEEDDPNRAAHAARAMRAAAPTSGGDLRLALHSGSVNVEQVATVASGLVLGQTPLQALHLARGAAPGEIRVSETTKALLRSAFDIETNESGVIALKEPLKASTSSGATVGTVVGREDDLRALLERWRRVPTTGGQVVLVTGEAGIGKTTLIRQLRSAAAADEPVFIEAQCAPDLQHAALRPIVNLLTPLVGMDGELDSEARGRALASTLTEHGFVLAETMPLFLPLFDLRMEEYGPLDVSPQRARALTLETIHALLSSMSERHPLIVVVEDLHWADATSLELLTRLVREVASSQIFLVMTARPDFQPAFSTTSMLQLHLSRLEPAQVQALVAGLVGNKELPPGVIERIAARTDGVPLFVEEVLRTMLDSKILVERERGYALAGSLDAADAEVPSTLRALLTARLDRLGRAKNTAQIAAALGREFRLDILVAASPDGAAVVAEDIEALTSAGLVLRKRRAQEPVGLFKHALVRDAVYDSLVNASKRDVHLKIARAIEERFTELAKTRPDLLAYHLGRTENLESAARYSAQAAAQALQRSDYVDVIVHARNALDWSKDLPDDERMQFRLQANGLLTQAMMATRGWGDPEFREVVRASEALLQQVAPTNPQRIGALWFLWVYHHTTGNRAEARSVSDELVELARSANNESLLSAARTLMGCTYHAEGKLIDARTELEAAVALYDRNRDRGQGAALGLDSLVLAKTLLGQLYWYGGDRKRAFDSVDEGLLWARELGHIPSLVMGLLYSCQVYQFECDRERTAAMTGEILGLCARYGLPAYEGYAVIIHRWAMASTDQVDMLLGILRGMSCNLCLSYYASLAADNVLATGDAPGALGRIDQCLEFVAQFNERFFEPELHRKRALCQRAIDASSPLVAQSLEKAVTTALEVGSPRTELLALLELSALGRLDEKGNERLRALESSLPDAKAVHPRR